MQASQDEGRVGSGASAAGEAEGLHVRPGEVVEITKPGWLQPVGIVRQKVETSIIELEKLVYERVELRELRLSHAAALFLLQGASIRQLLTDVLIPVGDEQRFFSVVFAEPACLWRPPPTLRRIVLARLIERPVDMPPEEVLRELFLAEVSAEPPLLLAPRSGVQLCARRVYTLEDP